MPTLEDRADKKVQDGDYLEWLQTEEGKRYLRGDVK
jgi:hypothetical protein